MEIKQSKILITGSSGFLGRHLTKHLTDNGYSNLLTPDRCALNLLDERGTASYLGIHKPNFIIHLAAVVGGIGANRKSPGSFFHDNMRMGLHLFHNSIHAGAKIIYVSTLCEYPKFANVPFMETEIWLGYPEETNAPYAVAKKALRVMLDAYRDQYGLQSISLVPSNMAGEYDHFDPENSHVIPALVRKVQEAIDKNSTSIEVWGDGSPSREFLYAGDCAEAIQLTLESNYDGRNGPVNIGTGREIKIRDLVALICSEMGYSGQIRYQINMPNGQPRRAVSTSRAEMYFGFKAKTSLEETIRRTVAYWNTVKDSA